MANVDTKFTAIENFNTISLDDLVVPESFCRLINEAITIQYSSPSLPKSCAIYVSQVPRDEEYNLRGRAKALVDKWYTIYQHCI